MPFKSRAQQKFMFATNPRKAKEWAKETDFSRLPEKKHPSVNPKGRKLKKKASVADLSSIFMRGFGDEITKTAGVFGRLFAKKPPPVSPLKIGLGKGLVLGGGAAAGAGAIGLKKGKEKGYESGSQDVVEVAQEARQLGRREGVMAYHQALQAKLRGGEG